VRVAALFAALVALAPPAAAPAKPPAAAAPQLEAQAWVLIDARTGETLAAHASARSLPIASATKLMTAHLALRELPLQRRVRMVPYSAIPAESLLGVPAGTPISVHDLLYSLILESANDSAYTLSAAVGGSQARFVEEMNTAAAALGLLDTHYSNPIGLDSPGNYSSARDLAALARRLLANRTFAMIADSTRARLASLASPLEIETRNTLLYRAPWVNGVKTGHTLGAGYVEVGAGRRKGVQLVSVVLGAPSETQRDEESLALLEYGFGQYRVRHPVGTNELLASPSIRYSGGELGLRATHPIAVGVRRGQSLRTAVRAPKEVTGPIPKGRRLGTVTVLLDGRAAGAAALVASRSVPKASSFDRLRSSGPFVAALIALGLFAILVFGLAFLRRWSRGQASASEEEMQEGREQRRRMREQLRNEGRDR
jgi:serine-type D-Ala-D-Ala carboxypeptidase (penicillin-binding protein 5/6)